MTSLVDETHPSQPRLVPRLVGTTGDLYEGSIADTAIKEDALLNYGSLPTSKSHHGRSQTPKENNHFKSAQWSPDGTTILTSSADHTLRSFILPPDLLTTPDSRPLQPYALHRSPEPVYATAFYPSYNLQDPSTCLALASPRSLPIRLFSPFTADRILASYPLVNPTTEAWTTPHSLLFHQSREMNTSTFFFAGSESCVSVFDLHRDGDGPVSRMHTTPSQRGRGAATAAAPGMKGIVSALGLSSEGMLAAGTYSRWVGLYDGFGRGGDAGVFSVAVGAEEEEDDDDDDDDDVVNKRSGGGGGGITQVLWSSCGRYLCVVERRSDGIGIWDIRGTGKRLAWLRGRKATTQQRLSAEVMGPEVWAGGSDGVVRVWEGVGMREGVVDPGWEFRAHGDAVTSTTLHASGSVLATCSGQRHPFRPIRVVDDSDGESDSETSQGLPQATTDNTLKLWAL